MEKRLLLTKAELNSDYKFKTPTESYRFDIMYIGTDPYKDDED